MSQFAERIADDHKTWRSLMTTRCRCSYAGLHEGNLAVKNVARCGFLVAGVGDTSIGEGIALADSAYLDARTTEKAKKQRVGHGLLKCLYLLRAFSASRQCEIVDLKNWRRR